MNGKQINAPVELDDHSLVGRKAKEIIIRGGIHWMNK